ncbi:TPA: hypothetical protein HGS83_16815 [Escherichia coli]|nr:hypothetical protein [Escherichia coli H30]EFA4559022.1 hypothetical protein [Escherichia coli]EFV8667048.1 hypothetical protein [Shigella boydii]EFV8764175.1 hypothetical protein [Shigella flexneri]EFB9826228.1 hypothetical protein [Escherichia coli]
MQELAISSAGGGSTSVYIAVTIYILSLGHRHIKPCPNPDVKNRLCVGFLLSSPELVALTGVR